MSYLPIILIVFGYVALIATAGPWGLLVAAVHIGAIVVGSALQRRKPVQRGRSNSSPEAP